MIYSLSLSQSVRQSGSWDDDIIHPHSERCSRGGKGGGCCLGDITAIAGLAGGKSDVTHLQAALLSFWTGALRGRRTERKLRRFKSLNTERPAHFRAMPNRNVTVFCGGVWTCDRPACRCRESAVREEILQIWVISAVKKCVFKSEWKHTKIETENLSRSRFLWDDVSFLRGRISCLEANMEREEVGRAEGEPLRGRDKILCYINMQSPGRSRADLGLRRGSHTCCRLTHYTEHRCCSANCAEPFGQMLSWLII